MKSIKTIKIYTQSLKLITYFYLPQTYNLFRNNSKSIHFVAQRVANFSGEAWGKVHSLNEIGGRSLLRESGDGPQLIYLP